MFENGIGPPVVEIPRNKRRPPQRRPPNHAQFNVVEAQYELEFTTWTTAAAPPTASPSTPPGAAWSAS